MLAGGDRWRGSWRTRAPLGAPRRPLRLPHRRRRSPDVRRRGMGRALLHAEQARLREIAAEAIRSKPNAALRVRSDRRRGRCEGAARGRGLRADPLVRRDAPAARATRSLTSAAGRTRDPAGRGSATTGRSSTPRQRRSGTTGATESGPTPTSAARSSPATWIRPSGASSGMATRLSPSRRRSSTPRRTRRSGVGAMAGSNGSARAGRGAAGESPRR